MASILQAELVSSSREAENLAGVNFNFSGNTFIGVLGVAPVELALQVGGYGESAQAMLHATLTQFSGSPPTNADAANRAPINIVNGREWKLVSVENDGLLVKLGLRLAV